jgi:hypothetical protein
MDNEEESIRSSVQLPSFSGMTNNFMIWWVHFRAFATVCRFVVALGDADEADLPAREGLVLGEANAADMKQIAARKRVALAMANCLVAFTNKTNLGMVFKAIATEWPAGKASTITRSLKAKHVLHDTMT